MALRYPTLVALTLAVAASLQAAASPRAHRRAAVHPAPPPVAADRIYSKQALRRAKIVIELKLLEFQRERLERVRKAIMKNEPIEQLLKTP